ncbi:hypothetical protein [Marinirhabdus gelatinilytica]|uniref:Outer membrane protein with beta-barrel domain n=1 Tax=Marinirhabdus gelatinilytica TaxID=1703343 RepID=A0A370Q739_9FLAO|nr:hypothetical protein [Marinirhabdus gelatinilytica]RDK84198.1 hypothetical protein C8D94_10542 [Marinirhabdus gelatinilytica]
MKKFLILALLSLTTTLSQAQFIKEKAIKAQIGYGLSAPYDTSDVVNDGFFAQAELILTAASWVDFRPYAGFVTTSSDGEDLNDNPTPFKAETTSFLLGGKARVNAPIPYVSPYIEIGIGTSIGTFTTVTEFEDIDKSGIVYHIPFSFGLMLGKNKSVDIGFSYYFQPSVEQFAGAFAVGISFPMND